MNRFKCPACGRYQYTSKDETEGCIYCVYKGPLENMGPAGVEKANLEQAIAYFEDAIRESDEIIAECSEALQKELMEQKKHFEIALKIMKKWNGEGDCKYCKNPSAYLAICQNYETRIFISVSGSYLQIFDEDYPGFCDNHKINFCPMCGRKLG